MAKSKREAAVVLAAKRGEGHAPVANNRQQLAQLL